MNTSTTQETASAIVAVSASPQLNGHLWIPGPEPSNPPNEQVSSSSRSAATVLKDRLYVGNLGTVVDEYTLLQVFSKYGKVSKLDFLFHKSGPSRGRPRGYAFVEFVNEADASRALDGAQGKLLRGRKLVVTFAHQAPLHSSGTSTPHGGKARRTDNTPTALSLAKSSGVGRSEIKTSSKIAMMEAKLRQMETSSVVTEKAPQLPLKPTEWTPRDRTRRRSSIPSTTGGLSNVSGVQAATAIGGGWTTESSCGKPMSKGVARPASMPESSKSHRLSLPGVKIVKPK